MDKTCTTCNNSFYVSPSRNQIKNCSYACNKIWRKCEANLKQTTYKACLCGCGSKIQMSKTRTKYLFGHHPQPIVRGGLFKKGHKRSRGVFNGNWRGGVSLMRNGYLQIRIDGKRKYLHRLIMEQELGRELEVTEQVHHIDHDKLNNSPRNLVVLTPKEHARYHSNVMWGNLTKGEYSL